MMANDTNNDEKTTNQPLSLKDSITRSLHGGVDASKERLPTTFLEASIFYHLHHDKRPETQALLKAGPEPLNTETKKLVEEIFSNKPQP